MVINPDYFLTRPDHAVTAFSAYPKVLIFPLRRRHKAMFSKPGSDHSGADHEKANILRFTRSADRFPEDRGNLSHRPTATMAQSLTDATGGMDRFPQDRWEALLKLIPGVIFEQRTDLSFVSVGPGAERFFGSRSGEIAKRSDVFLSCIHEDDRVGLPSVISAAPSMLSSAHCYWVVP